MPDPFNSPWTPPGDTLGEDAFALWLDEATPRTWEPRGTLQAMETVWSGASPELVKPLPSAMTHGDRVEHTFGHGPASDMRRRPRPRLVDLLP